MKIKLSSTNPVGMFILDMIGFLTGIKPKKFYRCFGEAGHTLTEEQFDKCLYKQMNDCPECYGEAIDEYKSHNP